jgi:hypothetical protein
LGTGWAYLGVLDIIMPLGNTDTRCVEKISFVEISGLEWGRQERGMKIPWKRRGV